MALFLKPTFGLVVSKDAENPSAHAFWVALTQTSPKKPSKHRHPKSSPTDSFNDHSTEYKQLCTDIRIALGGFHNRIALLLHLVFQIETSFFDLSQLQSELTRHPKELIRHLDPARKCPWHCNCHNLPLPTGSAQPFPWSWEMDMEPTWNEWINIQARFAAYIPDLCGIEALWNCWKSSVAVI